MIQNNINKKQYICRNGRVKNTFKRYDDGPAISEKSNIGRAFQVASGVAGVKGKNQLVGTALNVVVFK